MERLSLWLSGDWYWVSSWWGWLSILSGVIAGNLIAELRAERRLRSGDRSGA